MPKKKSTKLYQRLLRNGSIRIELIVAVVGFLLSIALHELMHVALHWHQIVGIQFFPNIYTVAEVIVSLPESYDLATEEFVGYSITAGVLVITAIVVARIHDKNDKRTVRQIIFPERTIATKPKTKSNKKK